MRSGISSARFSGSAFDQAAGEGVAQVDEGLLDIGPVRGGHAAEQVDGVLAERGVELDAFGAALGGERDKPTAAVVRVINPLDQPALFQPDDEPAGPGFFQTHQPGKFLHAGRGRAVAEQPQGLARLSALGLEKLAEVERAGGTPYMGLDLDAFRQQVAEFAAAAPAVLDGYPRLVLGE